jgi:hypothetical protein
MRAHKLQATLPEDHRLSVEAQLPEDFPPGPVEVIVLAGSPERRNIVRLGGVLGGASLSSIDGDPIAEALGELREERLDRFGRLGGAD